LSPDEKPNAQKRPNSETRLKISITKTLEKQHRLQMSQVFQYPRITIKYLLFKDSIARPLHPIGAAPNATLRSLDLAGLRRGLARS